MSCSRVTYLLPVAALFLALWSGPACTSSSSDASAGGTSPSVDNTGASATPAAADAVADTSAGAPTLQQVCDHMVSLARAKWEDEQSDTEGASGDAEQPPDFEALERQCKMEVGRKRDKQPEQFERMARCAVEAERLEDLFLCDPNAKRTGPRDPKLAPTRNDDAPPPVPRAPAGPDQASP